MDGRPAAAVLGVEPGADRTEIRRAYRALAKRAHPDTSGELDSAPTFRLVQRAFEVLDNLAVHQIASRGATPGWERSTPSPRGRVDRRDCRPRANSAHQRSSTAQPARDRKGWTFDDHLEAALAG